MSNILFKNIYLKNFFLCIVLVFLSLSSGGNIIKLKANFAEYMLLDGSEKLLSYGQDTTGNWWAITEPFSKKYRVIVNSYESEIYDNAYGLVFSPDGESWSYFASVGGSIYISTNHEDSLLNSATNFGEIAYSPDGFYRAFSYFVSNIEIISLPFNREIQTQNRVRNLYISNTGAEYAFVNKRLDKEIINITGVESTTYDEIIPIGFWSSGEFIYAARNGDIWEIIKGAEIMGDTYSKIISAKVNKYGTVLAVLVQLFTGQSMSIVFSDEYREPIYGKSYIFSWGLALHPSDVLIGFAATDGNRNFVLQNSTEYYANGDFGDPFYTHDGSELVFAGRGDFNPYININGRKFDIYTDFSPDAVIAKKPKNSTFAYSTNSTMLVQYYEKKEFYTGFMTDRTSETIYNWREGAYQTLGDIRDRLYMIRCVP